MRLPTIGEWGDAVASYAAALLASMAQVDWMHLGAIVLLVARLIHDVPAAFHYIKDQWKKYKDRP